MIVRCSRDRAFQRSFAAAASSCTHSIAVTRPWQPTTVPWCCGRIMPTPTTIASIILHAMKRFDEALSDYGQALDLQPHYADAFSQSQRDAV